MIESFTVVSLTTLEFMVKIFLIKLNHLGLKNADKLPKLKQ